MAGRRAPARTPTVFAQTPKVSDAKTQRALDVHHQAILDLQGRRHLEQFTSTEPGYVPESGGSDTDFLCADGTWKTVSGGGGAVDEVTAGSSKVTVSPTTGTVVVDVVPANFTGIPMGGVTFSGTNNRVAKFSAATLADSTITDTGALVTVANAMTVTGAGVFSSTLNGQGAVDFDSTLNVDGAATFNSTIHGIGAVDFDNTFNADGAGTFGSTLDVTGNFAVAANKFTVAAASGNTLVAGTLDVTGNFAVATNKFTVAATTGNTLVAGTLDVTGNFAVNTNKFTVAAATGNTVVAGTFTLSPMTLGSVPYISTAGLFIQANSNFFYNDSTKQLLLTSTGTPLSAVNSSTTIGQVGLQGTNAASPVDIFMTDNGGTIRGAFGYGNASLTDTTRRQTIYAYRATSSDFVITRGSGTSTLDFIIKGTDGKVGIGANASPGAALDLNGINPDIFVNGSNTGLIRFHTAGISAPTFTSRGSGTKVVLYPLVGASSADYALGIDNNTLWMSLTVSNTTEKFKWYGGTTLAASLDGTGGLTIGSATTVAHTTSGRVTQTSTTSTAHANSITWTPSAGATATQAALSITSNGTFTTAGGALSEYGLRVTASSTRSAGANDLTNVAGYFTSSGAQVNVALRTDAGDILLNQTGGTFSCAGAGTFTSTLGVTGNFAVNTNKFTVTASNGNTVVAGTFNGQGAGDFDSTLNVDGAVTMNAAVTIGDGSADTHTLNGNITFSNAPTAGSIKVGSLNGRIFLARQVITADATYTPTTGAKAALLRMIAAGGGGGGASAGGGTAGAGGGGGGAYFEKWIDPAASLTGGAATVGTGGAGGANTGGNGSTGEDTSIVIQGVTYTAKGGAGGTGMTTGTAFTIAPGGAGVSGSSAGDIVAQGQVGEWGFRNSGSYAHGGRGANSQWGAGGQIGTNSANAGTGYGSGGGGAGVSTPALVGGAGADGLIVIDEYA